ncbi:Uncharacterized protein dnm_058510 [Desulfonema magnum]|uniref:Uncharacterized protein n=1 Tax=Desulfonema magnum TaxID=45655 RepID=A0A975BQ38_9BACT|nr:Uncharacterized protein dnm_058510 [Desulfonema magnum]
MQNNFSNCPKNNLENCFTYKAPVVADIMSDNFSNCPKNNLENCLTCEQPVRISAVRKSLSFQA